MYTYEDLAELAHAKEDRRHHLVSRIRGWLRRRRSPRLTIGLLLIPTALFAVAADHGLQQGGLDLPPLRWTMVALAACPFFVLLLRWRAAAEWRSLRRRHLGLSDEQNDEAVEAAICASEFEEPSSTKEAVWNGVSQGIGQAGPTGLPLLLLLSAVTLGGWAVWKLIGSGSTLLADIIIDGEVMPATPSLATRIPANRWFPNALGAAGPYFVSLALAAFVAGLALPFFFR